MALAAAYRRFALEHPHLYRLMNNGPLPRAHLPPGLEGRTAAPLLRVAGSQARARAVWAFAHGMVMLELDQRFPPDADLDAAWRRGDRGVPGGAEPAGLRAAHPPLSMPAGGMLRLTRNRLSGS